MNETKSFLSTNAPHVMRFTVLRNYIGQARIGTNEEGNIYALLIAVHRGFTACGGIAFSLCDEHKENS